MIRASLKLNKELISQPIVIQLYLYDLLKYVKVAIIGSGCSGVLVLYHLSNLLRQRKEDNVSTISSIFIFEKNNCFGAGIPYSEEFNYSSFLLNMKTETMGIELNCKTDFAEWLTISLAVHICKEAFWENILEAYLLKIYAP